MAKQDGVSRAMGEQIDLVTTTSFELECYIHAACVVSVSGAELPGMSMRSSLRMTSLPHGVFLCFLSMHAGAPSLCAGCSFPVPYNSSVF